MDDLEESNLSMSPQSISPGITNADYTLKTTQSSAAIPRDRAAGDIDIISSTPSRPGKDYSVSAPYSHQTPIAGEGCSGDSLTERIASRNDLTEDLSPVTQNTDSASVFHHSELNAEFGQSISARFNNIDSSSGMCLYPNLDSCARSLAR